MAQGKANPSTEADEANEGEVVVHIIADCSSYMHRNEKKTPLVGLLSLLGCGDQRRTFFESYLYS